MQIESLLSDESTTDKIEYTHVFVCVLWLWLCQFSASTNHYNNHQHTVEEKIEFFLIKI